MSKQLWSDANSEHRFYNKNSIFFIKQMICILIVGMFAFTTSCYYDTEEDLYGTIECSLDDVGYTATILPIISDNCYQCHDQASNFGNITLEGYGALKAYVDNGQLLGAIKHQSGFSPMPKNLSKLLDCEIEKIEAWVNAGALNN